MKTSVYTALFGQYDGLLEQPVAADSHVDFICFTDDASLTSETWQIRVLEPAFRQDAVRSARLVKIMGHPSLDEYDVTLYIDASVLLKETPEAIIEEWLPSDADLVLARHSYREELVDEFDEVIRLNYDDRARVYEQLSDYALVHPAALTSRPLWTGMMVRRRSNETTIVMRTWANHVLRYSRRDQLSLPAALEGSALRHRVLDLDNFSSRFHEWPVIEGRRVAQGKAPELPSGPLVADLRRARVRIADLESRLSVIATETEQREAAAQYELARVAAERADVEQRLSEADLRAGKLAEQLHSMSGVRGATVHLWHSLGRKLVRRGKP